MIRLITLGALAVYWGGLFIGTHMPRGFRGLGHVDDKVMHVGAYAGLAFLLASALSSFRIRFGTLLLTMLIAAIYAGFDELSQLPIPGRQADVADWAADVLGAGIGALTFGIVLWIVTRRRSRLQSPSVTTRYERS